MTKNNQPNSQTILYTKKRLLGMDFFIVQSSYVAASISRNLEYFENSTFISHVFYFGKNVCGISDSKTLFTYLLFRNTNEECEKIDYVDKMALSTKIADKVETGKEYVQKLYLSSLTNAKIEEVKVMNDERDYLKNDIFHTFEDNEYLTRRMRFKKQSLSSRNRQNDQKNRKQYQDCEWKNQFETEQHSGSITETNTKNVLLSTKLDGRDIFYGNFANNKNSKSLLTESFPLIKECIKELIVLLEAKSNRKNIVNIKNYCYKHCVNILGACVFGKSVNELTNSKCTFYENVDQLYKLWRNNEKGRVGKFVRSTFVKLTMKKKCDQLEKTVEYFRNFVVSCFDGTHEGYKSCIVNSLVERFTETSNLQRDDQIGERNSEILI